MSEKPPAAILEISLFGGILLRHGAERVIELKSHKDRALVGFLAVSPGVPCSRDKLASLLWGDSGNKQARDSLKQALMRLRRALGAVSPMPLITNRQSVTLDRDAVTVDVGTFEQLLSDESFESSRRATELYRGDLLDGIQVRDSAFEDWLLVERQRLRDLDVEASARVMAQALTMGRRDCAALAARRLLSNDPLHETACRTLMQLHADRGEGTQALKLFESLRDRLRRELSVAPEPDTIALYDAIRKQRTGSLSREAPSTNHGGVEELPLARVEPEKPSIAVLPFVNMSDDAEQEYFADGLSEDITTDLSKVSGLFVAARNSVFTFKGMAVQVQQVARELNVSYVLKGSVRKAADRVRITAQLVDGTTGDHLWANRYDRRLSDIFALQDEIAERIVDVLKVKLLPEELKYIGSHSTINVDAYQYYLRGRAFYLRGIDKHSLRIAREMFVKATEIDPSYALAYASMAICESYLSMSASMKDSNASFESCLANSLRALDLDPNLAEAYAGKGLALYAAGRYADAAAEFKQAIDLGPHLFEAHFFYARNCRLQGFREQAAALFERSSSLRPNDFRSLGLYSEECQALGRHDDFMAAARRCLARIEAEIETHPDNAGALAFGSAVLVDLGQREKAEDWAERALMIGPDDSLVHYNVARTYSLLGALDRALGHLEQSYCCSPLFQRRLAMWMRYDEDLDELRAQPRFRSLVERLRVELVIEW
ncbi:MAG: BTAD domain-containing putative transcriptional regulator [Pseudomonadota bacterium]